MISGGSTVSSPCKYKAVSRLQRVTGFNLMLVAPRLARSVYMYLLLLVERRAEQLFACLIACTAFRCPIMSLCCFCSSIFSLRLRLQPTFRISTRHLQATPCLALLLSLTAQAISSSTRNLSSPTSPAILTLSLPPIYEAPRATIFVFFRVVACLVTLS